jgi:hypothetical protein
MTTYQKSESGESPKASPHVERSGLAYRDDPHAPCCGTCAFLEYDGDGNRSWPACGWKRAQEPVKDGPRNNPYKRAAKKGPLPPMIKVDIFDDPCDEYRPSESQIRDGCDDERAEAVGYPNRDAEGARAFLRHRPCRVCAAMFDRAAVAASDAGKPVDGRRGGGVSRPGRDGEAAVGPATADQPPAKASPAEELLAAYDAAVSELGRSDVTTAELRAAFKARHQVDDPSKARWKKQNAWTWAIKHASATFEMFTRSGVEHVRRRPR